LVSGTKRHTKKQTERKESGGRRFQGGYCGRRGSSAEGCGKAVVGKGSNQEVHIGGGGGRDGGSPRDQCTNKERPPWTKDNNKRADLQESGGKKKDYSTIAQGFHRLKGMPVTKMPSNFYSCGRGHIPSRLTGVPVRQKGPTDICQREGSL